MRNRIPERVKRLTWKRVDKIATAWEPRFAEEAAKQLELDKRGVLAALHAGKAKAVESKATVDWNTVDQDAEYFLRNAGARWRKAFIPLIQGVMLDQGAQWNAQFGIQFDVANTFGEVWFNDYILKFATDPLQTTSDMVHGILAQGLEEGWSIPTMQDHLSTTFEQWIEGNKSPADFEWLTERMPAQRTEKIARTETLRSSNAGSNALFDDWGVEYREWYATPDDRTREAHQIGAAFGQEPLIAKAGEPFIVGGEALMYPGDPAGSPANTIQCRCTILPWLSDESQQPQE